ncbi:1,4-beta-xylanase [Cohnella sp. CFH 77786]|uniref:endo-1,4-beta-xylanase n=1 Tax=Cohnella sp. CFH 77786 TaxID=2662265 RepID=UPI001C60BF75|nr:endo-1,4-beta-xylanase [Cohnella sp. CFH 77786]MBW5447696.1 1,4-beta-xylanase [Cohnella sp. CFH 77786]
MTEKPDEAPSLCRVYEDRFRIGAAVNPWTLAKQQALLRRHFNSLTAENEMKFERIHPLEDRYDFTAADALMAFAEEGGMAVRGHTLVWHNQTPAWVFKGPDGEPVDRTTLLGRMRSHIHAVVGRYKGRIYAWDAVNEAVADEGDDLLRESPWRSIAGDDYIGKAFEYAHEADPDCRLFYNDYNESFPAKREKIYRLVEELKRDNVPIHGVGMQAHWNLFSPGLDDIREAIERYASLGLEIHITELDMSVFAFEDRRTDLQRPTEEMQRLQEERYASVFALFREYAAYIKSVTFWGAADDYTWLDGFPVKGRKNWPFLFDELHRPKGAFWDVLP